MLYEKSTVWQSADFPQGHGRLYVGQLLPLVPLVPTANSARHISSCDVLQSTYSLQLCTDRAEQGPITRITSYYVLLQWWAGLEKPV